MPGTRSFFLAHGGSNGALADGVARAMGEAGYERTDWRAPYLADKIPLTALAGEVEIDFRGVHRADVVILLHPRATAGRVPALDALMGAAIACQKPVVVLDEHMLNNELAVCMAHHPRVWGVPFRYDDIGDAMVPHFAEAIAQMAMAYCAYDEAARMFNGDPDAMQTAFARGMSRQIECWIGQMRRYEDAMREMQRLESDLSELQGFVEGVVIERDDFKQRLERVATRHI